MHAWMDIIHDVPLQWLVFKHRHAAVSFVNFFMEYQKFFLIVAKKIIDIIPLRKDMY